MHLYILTLITPEMSYYLGLWCLLLNGERVQNNFKTKGEVRDAVLLVQISIILLNGEVVLTLFINNEHYFMFFLY